MHDLFENVVCLVNLEGEVLERYCYTAYGERDILNANEEKIPTSVTNNPWQYADRRFDEETQLVAFGLRDYDPEMGRWISPDPTGFKDGPNLYAYIRNSPFIYFDQYGLETEQKQYTTGCTQCQPESVHKSVFKDRDVVKHVYVENLPPVGSGSAANNRRISERTKTYTNNGVEDQKGMDASYYPEHPIKKIMFVNGIMNRLNDFRKSLLYLSSLAYNNITGVHSASFGLFRDILYYFKALKSFYAYEAVRNLHASWDEFFKQNPENGTILVICHSRGAVYTRNALMSYPPELRSRIHVIAVAPGAYIEDKYCGSVVHLVSKSDLVPKIDYQGRRRCAHSTIVLNRHKDESFFSDHSLTSKTYYQPIKNLH